MFYVVPRSAIEDVARSMPLDGAADAIIEVVSRASFSECRVPVLAWLLFAARYDRAALASTEET